MRYTYTAKFKKGPQTNLYVWKQEAVKVWSPQEFDRLDLGNLSVKAKAN